MAVDWLLVTMSWDPIDYWLRDYGSQLAIGQEYMTHD